jgi:hypothetical protein
LHWVAPTEKDAADQFRANSGPILRLIFLRFAEARFMLRGDDHE